MVESVSEDNLQSHLTGIEIWQFVGVEIEQLNLQSHLTGIEIPNRKLDL